jgi:hypothetical protein
MHCKFQSVKQKTEQEDSFICVATLTPNTDAEIGSVFLNAKETIFLQTTLEEMGHPQPPTPLRTDNTTSTGYSNDTIKQRCTRAMDMIFYWVKDRVK